MRGGGQGEGELRNNIVLVGFMGSGKTSVGKLLAKKLGYQYIDTDALIEKSEGKSISAIFSEEGEGRFRGLEAKIVRELTALKDHVISTGGGIVINKDNITSLKKNGIIIWLKAAPETILLRVGSETHRPLLNVENPLEKIKSLLTLREPYYAEADMVIDTDGLKVSEIAEKVINNLAEVRSKK